MVSRYICILRLRCCHHDGLEMIKVSVLVLGVSIFEDLPLSAASSHLWKSTAFGFRPQKSSDIHKFAFSPIPRPDF
jgi:hypothetical protein